MCNENINKHSIVDAKILSNKEIASGIYELIFEDYNMASSAIAGQFINVYCKSKALLLPRPISICEVSDKEGWVKIVYDVVGKGTEEMSVYKGNEDIRVLGPLGNGYEIKDANKSIVVAGGVGTPPILELIKRLRGDIDVYLGFRNEPFLIEDIKKYANVHVATDDGSYGYHGTVMDLLNKNEACGEALYACGPKPMLRAIKEWCDNKDIKAQISLEERMGCGIGACVGCAVKIKATNSKGWINKKVCTDGPVFLAEEVVFDE